MDKENDLIKILKLDAKVLELKNKIVEIDHLLELIDKQITIYETEETELTNLLAETYNKLNLKRIGLELRKNKLEHDLLLIEYDHAIAE